MNVIQALNWRYAVKQFSDERLNDQRVHDLLTAARMSASAFGLQPYRLVVVNDLNVRKQLLEYSMGQEKVVNCSHLIVFAAQKNVGDEMVDRYIESLAQVRSASIDEFAGMGDHIKRFLAGLSPQQQETWAHEQTYIALGTFLTAAAMMQIDACPMTGFERDGFDEVLGLNKMGLESCVICTLGVRHPEDLSASQPKVRYSHADMVITL